MTVNPVGIKVSASTDNIEAVGEAEIEEMKTYTREVLTEHVMAAGMLLSVDLSTVDTEITIKDDTITVTSSVKFRTPE